MAKVLNYKLKKDRVKNTKGKQLKIGYRTVNKILNKFVGKPRKIRKVFFLSNEQKKKRVEFCKMVLKKNWTGKEIFFKDETQIDLSNYLNVAIRLNKEIEEKLKQGKLDVYDLVTRPKKNLKNQSWWQEVFQAKG